MNADQLYLCRVVDYVHTERSAWFDAEAWVNDKELRQSLREKSGLEDTVKQLDSEWEQILCILNWVHGLSQHQGWKQAPDLSAHALLAGAEDGSVMFRCVEFGNMLQQTLLAFGFPSRVVGLSCLDSDYGYGRGHVLADVWCNDFGKWVVVDAQFNIFYTDKTGRPLSAFELHDLVMQRRFDDIIHSREAEMREQYNRNPMEEALDQLDKETFEVPEGIDKELLWECLPERGDWQGYRDSWLKYFRHLTWNPRTTLDRARGKDGNGKKSATYFYRDPQDLPPMLFEFAAHNVQHTTDRHRIDVPLNGVEIQWTSLTSDMGAATADGVFQYRLEFRHSMPWFTGYEVIVNGRPLEPDGDGLDITLRPGKTEVVVVPRNDVGRRGVASRVVFEVNTLGAFRRRRG